MEIELTEDWAIVEEFSRTKDWDYVDLGPKAERMIEYRVRSFIILTFSPLTIAGETENSQVRPGREAGEVQIEG